MLNYWCWCRATRQAWSTIYVDAVQRDRHDQILMLMPCNETSMINESDERIDAGTIMQIYRAWSTIDVDVVQGYRHDQQLSLMPYTDTSLINDWCWCHAKIHGMINNWRCCRAKIQVWSTIALMLCKDTGMINDLCWCRATIQAWSTIDVDAGQWDRHDQRERRAHWYWCHAKIHVMIIRLMLMPRKDTGMINEGRREHRAPYRPGRRPIGSETSHEYRWIDWFQILPRGNW